MKSEHQQRVEKFMRRVAGQDVPTRPIMPDHNTRLLRARLIMEEALETVKALGFRCCWSDSWDTVGITEHNISFLKSMDTIATGGIGYTEPSMVDIVDGCADLSVVTIGTLSACGVADGPVLEEVDKSNLSKKGGYKDAFGKLVKPPTYTEADFARVLKEQGWEE